MDTKALALHTQATKAGYFDFDLEDFSDYVEVCLDNKFPIPTNINDVITEMNEMLKGE